MNEPQLLYIASSMIERDALKARLEGFGVETLSPKRDISRKYTESTVDLSHGGYSAVFDGFKIFVNEKDLKTAQDCLENFNKEKEEPLVEEEKPSYLKKFHFFSISSLFVPLVPVLFGLYFFYKGIRNGEKPRIAYTVFSLILYLPQIGFYYMGVEKLKEFGILN